MNSEAGLPEGCMDLSSRVELQAFEHWRTKPSLVVFDSNSLHKGSRISPKLRMAQFGPSLGAEIAEFREILHFG